MRYTLDEYTGLVARFSTGDTVTISVYEISHGAAVALGSNSCPEIGATGYFTWDTSNITTYPSVKTEYLWVMTEGSSESAGKIIIGGYPDEISDGTTQILTTIRKLYNNLVKQWSSWKNKLTIK